MTNPNDIFTPYIPDPSLAKGLTMADLKFMVMRLSPANMLQFFPPQVDYAQLSPDAYMEPQKPLMVVSSRLVISEEMLEKLYRPNGVIYF